MTTRLHLDPRLAHRWDEAGNLVFFRFEEPHDSVCVARDAGLLAQLFAGPLGGAVDEISSQFLRLTGELDDAAGRAAVREGIEYLKRAGILVERRPVLSLYDGSMAPFYRDHRATPAAIAEVIAREAQIGPETRVLDVGTGTGSLAIALSRWSGHVAGLDASEQLLQIAVTDARACGSRASFVRASANDLVFSSERHDVVVVSQAFHWFDPALAVHGLYRVLAETGSIFLVETKYELAPGHPLRTLMGIGTSSQHAIKEQCVEHARRYELLFEHLRRKPPFLRLRAFHMFRERRPLDLGFARAFCFAAHVAAASNADLEQPWEKLEALMNDAEASSLLGNVYWYVAKYQRHGASIEPSRTAPLTEIGDGGVVP